MKQLMIIVAALAATTLFAQSSDLDKLEASITQVMQDAENATQDEASKADIPDSKNGKKDAKTEENTSEQKDVQSK